MSNMKPPTMQWVECPLLDDDGAALHPPSCSDDEDGDEDNPIDLLSRREGHCATALSGPQQSSWVVVCGGFTNGALSAAPLVAPTSLLPALQWRQMPEVAECECDGASLTIVDAADGLDALSSSSTPVVCCSAAPVAYLFGGFNSDFELCNTLYAVTLAGAEDHTGRWTPSSIAVAALATTGTVPPPVARHGAGGSGGRLYIFGGETSEEEQTNSLYVCTVQSGVWRTVATSVCSPLPRLLSSSLVFVSPTVFVLYGGSHFVEGAVESFRDVWSCDVAAETWRPVAQPQEEEEDSECRGLPHSNGHVGGAVVWPCSARVPSCRTCAVFIGGKNFETGDDRVKMVRYTPATRAFEVCARDAEPAVGTGKYPHWRYTAALVATKQGLLLLAGQCRHPQVPSSFLLTFA